MIVCAKCGVKMKCVKTGALVRFQNNTTISSDVFECQKCGAKIAECSADPYKDNSPTGKDDVLLDE